MTWKHPNRLDRHLSWLHQWYDPTFAKRTHRLSWKTFERHRSCPWQHQSRHSRLLQISSWRKLTDSWSSCQYVCMRPSAQTSARLQGSDTNYQSQRRPLLLQNWPTAQNSESSYHSATAFSACLSHFWDVYTVAEYHLFVCTFFCGLHYRPLEHFKKPLCTCILRQRLFNVFMTFAEHLPAFVSSLSHIQIVTSTSLSLS